MPLRCPVYKADNPQGPTCRRCKADLEDLFALEAQREQELSAARALLVTQPGQARAHAHSATRIRRYEESLRLQAVAHLLAGDYRNAWRVYRSLSSDKAQA